MTFFDYIKDQMLLFPVYFVGFFAAHWLLHGFCWWKAWTMQDAAIITTTFILVGALSRYYFQAPLMRTTLFKKNSLLKEKSK